MLGSHNSWTFLKPKKWWMKVINFIGKCQNLNIQEQYARGVRVFDLRVRYNKKGELIVAHGLLEYKHNLKEDLNFLNIKGDCYIRILHETRTKKQYETSRGEDFKKLATDFEKNYPGIKFIGGQNMYTRIEDYIPTNSYLPGTELHASVASPKELIPVIYASRMNKKLRKIYKEDLEGEGRMLMIDFVDK